MLVVIIRKRDNQFESWRQLAVPLLAGATLALAQISILDIIRFALTRTWGGFAL
jgi:hypothetical protein